MSTWTIPDQYRTDPNDTEQERERKRAAAREWTEGQAEGSREGAIHCVSVVDFDIPLVRYLTDEEVDRLARLSQDMCLTLRTEGLEGAETLVLATLLTNMRSEQARREEAARQARIAMESNGHEAFLNADTEDWFVVCSCEYDSGDQPTREAALKAGEGHFTEHGGGRWRHDLSD